MSSTLHAASADAVELRPAAQLASTLAYVPYSGFRAGPAIQLRGGEVVVGCNVENASYGATICAERTALVRLVAEGRSPSDAQLVVVHVDGDDGQPCGICRQMLVELVPQARIAFLHGGELVECDVTDLLPAAFVPAALDAT